MRQQGGPGARTRGVCVLDEDGEAAERHQSEEDEADVDVDVELWGDDMQDNTTKNAVQRPEEAPGVVRRQEGHSEGGHEVGDTQVGQINMNGGDRGDAVKEHPERYSVSWERSEAAEGIDRRDEGECDSGGAENEGGSVFRGRRV